MPIDKETSKALIVANSENDYRVIKNIVGDVLKPVLYASSMVEARQKINRENISVIIINTPISDEFGVQSALDIIKYKQVGILLLVKADLYNKVTYMVKDSGIVVVQKPVDRLMLYQSASILCVMQRKISELYKENQKLSKKLQDLNMISRAKCLLIEKEGMTEETSHHYIEKRAMDEQVTKKEAAMEIIQKYT